MFFPKYYTLKRIVQGVGNSLKIQHVDVIQNKKNRTLAYLKNSFYEILLNFGL